MKIDALVVLEWVATFVLLAGVALTAWNVYPLNIYVQLTGNFLWLFVAFMWRKWSIITLQGVIVIIYLAGLIGKGVWF